MNQQDILNQEVPIEVELPEELPEIIPNSTLQLDGDISCYYTAWVDMPLGACIKQLKQHIEIKRLLAGCEVVNVHTTHGAKAGREDIAQVNMYQDTRKKNQDEEKSERVKALRQFLQTYETDTVKPCPQFEVEADDSMNIYQRIEMDIGNYSAICTKDKDLDMCPGNHFTYDDMEHYTVPDGYGKLKKTVTQVPAKTKSGVANKTKISGVGTSFFWFQVLLGDTADSIPGLPALAKNLVLRYAPTAAVTKALQGKGTPAARKRTLDAVKSKPLGQVLAYNMLKNAKSDQEAFNIVKEAYEAYYGKQPFDFEGWRGNILKDMTAGKMILEQARLLWMLRTWDDDVIKFFGEVLDV